MPTFDLADIGALLGANGLIVRGGVDFADGEEAPSGPSGQPAKSVLLVGHGGAAHWPHFTKWRAQQPADLKDPLDSWSREVIGAVAEKFGARAVSPSDRPYLPFQQWAMRAEGLRPSPLGVLIHPEFGLWHAYRGALLFDRPLGLGKVEAPIHLCDGCAGKPCLKACPAEAYSGAGFDYLACTGHAGGPAGAECRDAGCLARRACPFGTAYRYPPDMQGFHMAAFLR